MGSRVSPHEAMLAEWDRLSWSNRLNLLWRSTSSFWDALWLQTYRWEEAMIQDLRYGVRMLLKHKAVTLIAIVTLAIGIGANTSVFSVVNAVLLRALPFADAERLVMIWETQPDVRGPVGTYQDFLDWRADAQSFQGMSAFSNKRYGKAELTGHGETIDAQGMLTLDLLVVSALLALLLAAIGIYGVVAYSVAHLTQEIGIRLALGAQASDILKLVIRRGLAPALFGVAGGLAGASALSRWLTSLTSDLLFEVRATDPMTFAAISALLLAIALLACYLPARRATRIDPLVALRHE